MERGCGPGWASRRRATAAMALAAALATAGCGGGDGAAGPAAGAPRNVGTPAARDVTRLAEGRVHPLAAGDTIDATQLMNWAELTFPQLFPSREQNIAFPPYLVRFYPATQNYIGVAGDSVLLLGPATGGQLLTVGTLADFACHVLIATCEAPVIAAAPASASVRAGDAVSFSATVGGGPSISYQWLRNDQPLPGATTATLGFVAQEADHGARYALRASNAKGSTTSAAATLTVARAVDATAAMALAGARGCFSCHDVDVQVTGPAFRAVGQRYAGNAGALPLLVTRIRFGAFGTWGLGSMPAQSQVSPPEAEQIVAWILTLR